MGGVRIHIDTVGNSQGRKEKEQTICYLGKKEGGGIRQKVLVLPFCWLGESPSHLLKTGKKEGGGDINILC